MSAEPPPITGRCLKSIRKVVVQSKIRLLHVAVGQAVFIAGVRIWFSREKLLHATHELRPPHDAVPCPHLTQTVRTFHPIAAAVTSMSIFKPKIQRNGWWLPGKVQSNRLCPVCLKQLLP